MQGVLLRGRVDGNGCRHFPLSVSRRHERCPPLQRRTVRFAEPLGRAASTTAILGCGQSNCVVTQSRSPTPATAAYRAISATVPNDGFRFFQTFSSAVSGNPGYRQDRNLTRYDSLEGYVRNDTGTDLTFTLELKDYRDSNSQRGQAELSPSPPAASWTQDRSAARFEFGLECNEAVPICPARLPWRFGQRRLRWAS